MKRFLIACLFFGFSSAAFSQKFLKSFENGVKLMGEGKYEMAVTEFNSVIAAKATYSDAYFQRGRCYLYLNRSADAKKDFDKAIELDPKKAAYYNSRGTASELLKDTTKAIENYNKAISLDSSDFKPLYNLARLLDDIGRDKEALTYIDLAIKRTTPDAEMYFAKATIYDALNDTARSRQAYKATLALDSNFYNAVYNLAFMNNNAGDYKLGLKYAERALRIDPKNADGYTERGRSLEGLKDTVSALSSYSKAIEIDKQNTFAYFNRGNLYSSMGRNSAAINDYTKMIELDPNDADAYFSRGICYADTDNYVAALTDLETAKKINPGDAEIYFQIGIVQDETRYYREAISSFSEAIKLDSLNAGYYYSRGNSYYNLEDLETAKKEYMKALQLDSTEAGPYFNLGNIHFDKKEFDKALPYYDTYLKYTPDDADAYVNRGICLKELKRVKEACDDWQKAATLGSSEARENQKKFCKVK